MKYMVCNCDSYGTIDYGKPILFNTNDYRTSSAFGLRYIPLPNQEFYPERTPVSKNAGNPLLEIKDEMYKSQSAKTYDEKYRKYMTGGKPNRPLALPKTHYMRVIKEKTFKDPPAPKKFELVEYKEEFCLKQPETKQDIVKNINAQAVCMVASIGRGEQPRIKIEEKGVMKQLDPYVSTNSVSYIPFTKDQIHYAKHGILTFYNAKSNPELQRIKIRKPINDETKFKKVIKDRIVPNVTFPVPFTGKTSEYKGSYLNPTKDCMYTQIFDNSVEFKDSLSNPSKWQTITAPNMYCTEYCHIGTGRPIKAAVNTKEAKKEYIHNDCK